MRDIVHGESQAGDKPVQDENIRQQVRRREPTYVPYPAHGHLQCDHERQGPAGGDVPIEEQQRRRAEVLRHEDEIRQAHAALHQRYSDLHEPLAPRPERAAGQLWIRQDDALLVVARLTSDAAIVDAIALPFPGFQEAGASPEEHRRRQEHDGYGDEVPRRREAVRKVEDGRADHSLDYSKGGRGEGSAQAAGGVRIVLRGLTIPFLFLRLLMFLLP
mmetsp:Transcript_37143/g.89601  ORF Transcript_37143/g.89601 Transcript_37143/m.89601 type:complete len:217 (+) Transcript_37143:746-1396(+)